MSVTIHTSRTLPNGLERRRYKITLTDLVGGTHERIVGPVNVQPADDGSSYEAQLIDSLKQSEVDQYIETVREGVNPFDSDSLWNSRNELLKPILDEALSKPATDPMVYNGLPYLALVTDAELMALYSEDQSWVDNVRSQASSLLSGKATLDSYTPVLGGD